MALEPIQLGLAAASSFCGVFQCVLVCLGAGVDVAVCVGILFLPDCLSG